MVGVGVVLGLVLGIIGEAVVVASRIQIHLPNLQLRHSLDSSLPLLLFFLLSRTRGLLRALVLGE